MVQRRSRRPPSLASHGHGRAMPSPRSCSDGLPAGVCLLGSELQEIEDAAGARRALARCPRHNKTFDLRSGVSSGNPETLKVYPCRFDPDEGRWYVGVEPEPVEPERARGAPLTPEKLAAARETGADAQPRALRAAWSAAARGAGRVRKKLRGAPVAAEDEPLRVGPE